MGIVDPYFRVIVALGVLGVILRDIMELGIPNFGNAIGRKEDYQRTGTIPVYQMPDQDTPHATYGEAQEIKIRFNGRNKS